MWKGRSVSIIFGGLINEGGVYGVVVLAAAALYDTIEDTMTILQELTNLFGEVVVGIEVSDDRPLTKVHCNAAN